MYFVMKSAVINFAKILKKWLKQLNQKIVYLNDSSEVREVRLKSGRQKRDNYK